MRCNKVWSMQHYSRHFIRTHHIWVLVILYQNIEHNMLIVPNFLRELLINCYEKNKTRWDVDLYYRSDINKLAVNPNYITPIGYITTIKMGDLNIIMNRAKRTKFYLVIGSTHCQNLFTLRKLASQRLYLRIETFIHQLVCLV